MRDAFDVVTQMLIGVVIAIVTVWLLVYVFGIFACSVAPVLPQSDRTCSGACMQIRELGCEGDSPAGVRCERWCEAYHERGLKPWNECAAQATSVSAMRACGIVCP